VTVDIDAVITLPFRLDALLLQASEILSTLVGAPPEPFTAMVGRMFQSGVMIREGESPEAGLLVGDFGVRDADDGRPPSQFFDLAFGALGDQARLMVIDHTSREFGGRISACVSPYRTPVGVATATSVALAVAELGRGAFEDVNIRFIDPPVYDPVKFIELARRPATDEPFSAACLTWVRSFPNLGGWPPPE
jgi:hypothetical protein